MPPSLPLLRSGDAAAWGQAYPLLWAAGMNVACVRLWGSHHAADREDCVTTALQQVQRGLMGKTTAFNQMLSWDDVLGMMRHITRLRIHDFFRSLQRKKEDAMEVLPELPVESSDSRFHLAELMTEVAQLQPDPPVPQLFSERFMEGYSTDEIAEKHQMSRNTVVSHFSRGLRTLRERLTRLEETA